MINFMIDFRGKIYPRKQVLQYYKLILSSEKQFLTRKSIILFLFYFSHLSIGLDQHLKYNYMTQKTKPIRKKKQCRRGRPQNLHQEKKEDDIFQYEHQQSTAHQIREEIFTYFQLLERNGLLIDKNERKKLKLPEQPIFQQTVEKDKIKAFLQRIPSQYNQKKIQFLLLHVGEITASECTSQIYELITSMILRENPAIIFNKLWFFVGKELLKNQIKALQPFMILCGDQLSKQAKIEQIQKDIRDIKNINVRKQFEMIIRGKQMLVNAIKKMSGISEILDKHDEELKS